MKTIPHSIETTSVSLVTTLRIVTVTSVFAVALCIPVSGWAITNGQPDGTAHPYVALVTELANLPSTSPPACCPPPVCSAVAISPTVLVTTAGCTSTNTPGDLVFVTFDPQGAFATNPLYLTGRYYPDPDFCVGCGGGFGSGFVTHTLAVVVLDQPVSLPRYAQLPAPDVVDTLPVGTGMTIVGYGFQAPLKKIRRGGGGFWTREFALAELLGTNESLSDEYIKISSNQAQGKGGLCFSDGGAPVLLDHTDTVVATGSFTANSNCVGVSWAQRLDTPDAIAFINQFLGP